MIKKILIAFKKYLLDTEVMYITNVSLISLLSVWFLNPTNKVILIIFAVTTFLFYWRLKNLTLSILLVFFLASPLLIGKTYTIQLRDLSEFYYLRDIYPMGIVSNIVITISDCFFTLFITSLIIDIKKKRHGSIYIKPFDYLILGFILYGIFADIIGSRRIYYSLIVKKEFYEYAVIYFYIRFFVANNDYFLKTYRYIFSSMIIFQSFIAFLQFLHSSPLGKNIEVYHNAIIYGRVVDESHFIFRPLGTFEHANFFALFLVTGITLLFLHVRKNIIFLVAVIFGSIAVLLTLSRTAWLAFFISLIYFLYILEYKLKKNVFSYFTLKRVIILLLIFLPLLIYSSPRLIGTIYSFQESGGLYLRVKQIYDSLELLSTHPFIGTGTGMSVVEAIEKSKTNVFTSFPSPIHNFYFLLMVENGIPSLILLIAILFFGLKAIARQKKVFKHTLVATFLTVVIGGIFQPYFDFMNLFILLALCF